MIFLREVSIFLWNSWISHLEVDMWGHTKGTFSCAWESWQLALGHVAFIRHFFLFLATCLRDHFLNSYRQLPHPMSASARPHLPVNQWYGLALFPGTLCLLSPQFAHVSKAPYRQLLPTHPFISVQMPFPPAPRLGQVLQFYVSGALCTFSKSRFLSPYASPSLM